MAYNEKRQKLHKFLKKPEEQVILKILINIDCNVFDSLKDYIKRETIGYLNKGDVYEAEFVWFEFTHPYYRIWYNDRVGYIWAGNAAVLND